MQQQQAQTFPADFYQVQQHPIVTTGRSRTPQSKIRIQNPKQFQSKYTPSPQSRRVDNKIYIVNSKSLQQTQILDIKQQQQQQQQQQQNQLFYSQPQTQQVLTIPQQQQQQLTQVQQIQQKYIQSTPQQLQSKSPRNIIQTNNTHLSSLSPVQRIVKPFIQQQQQQSQSQYNSQQSRSNNTAQKVYYTQQDTRSVSPIQKPLQQTPQQLQQQQIQFFQVKSPQQDQQQQQLQQQLLKQQQINKENNSNQTPLPQTLQVKKVASKVLLEEQQLNTQQSEAMVDEKVNYLLDEIELIQQLLQKKVDQNKELKEQVSDLQLEKDQLLKQIEMSKSTVTSIHESETNKNSPNRANNNNVLDEDLSQYNQKLQTQQNAIKQIIKQRLELKEETLKLKLDVQELENQLSSQRQKHQEDKQSLENETVQLRNQILTHQQNQEQSIKQFQLQKSSFEQTLQQSKSTYEQQLLQQKQSYEAQISTTINQIDQLEIQFKKQIQEYQEKLSQQEEQVKFQLDQTNHYKSLYGKTETQTNEIRKEFSDKEAKLKQDITNLTILNEDHTTKIKDLENIVIGYQQKNQKYLTLEQDLKQYIEKSMNLESQIEENKIIIQQQETHINEILLSKQTEIQSNKTLIQDNTILAQEIEKIKKLLDIEQRENAYKQNQIQENKRMIEELYKYKQEQQNKNYDVIIDGKDRQINYWQNKFHLLEEVLKKYNDFDSLLTNNNNLQ